MKPPYLTNLPTTTTTKGIDKIRREAYLDKKMEKNEFSPKIRVFDTIKNTRQDKTR
jgi:hypothetical protein